MKVPELIEILQSLDPDALVVLYGDEGGVDTPVTIEETEIVLNAHDEDYYGAHEEVGGFLYIASEYDKLPREKAVLISLHEAE